MPMPLPALQSTWLLYDLSAHSIDSSTVFFYWLTQTPRFDCLSDCVVFDSIFFAYITATDFLIQIPLDIIDHILRQNPSSADFALPEKAGYPLFAIRFRVTAKTPRWLVQCANHGVLPARPLKIGLRCCDTGVGGFLARQVAPFSGAFL
jgi:hypothetical protein